MVTMGSSFSLSDSDEAKVFVVDISVNIRQAGKIVTVGCDIVPLSGHTLTWDWGDGTVENNLTGSPEPHTYSSPGTYVIRVTGPIASIGSTTDGKMVSISPYDDISDPDVNYVTVMDGGYGCLSAIGQYDSDETFSFTRGVFMGFKFGNVHIPDTVEVVGNQTFYGNTSGSLRIPSSARMLGSGAYRSCGTSFSFGSLPSGLERIGPLCFMDSGAASSVDLVIPKSVSYIGSQAFSASKIRSISVDPENSTFYSIGGKALVDASSSSIVLLIGQVTIPDGIVSLQGSCSKGVSSYSLRSVVLPQSVTSIGHSAFSGCSYLNSINLPSGLTSIGGNAFSGCTALSSNQVIPGGVATLYGYTYQGSFISSFKAEEGFRNIDGYYAFGSCTNLRSVHLPRTFTGFTGVSSGSNYHFYGCTALTSLTVESPSVISGLASSYSPPTLSSLKLYVPPYLVNGYKAVAPWSSYKSNVLPYYGETAIDITVSSSTTVYLVKPTTSSGYAIVDWGDGSSTQTATSDLQHQYAPGSYTVIITGNVTGLSGTTDGSVYPVLSARNSAWMTREHLITNIRKIGHGVTSLSGSCFARVDATDVYLHPGITTWSEKCFAFSAASKIVVAGGLTILPDYAFYYASSLVYVDLPSTVTRFRNRPFQGVSAGFQTLVVRATTPPDYTGSSASMLYDLPSTTDIYVPDSSVQTYKNTIPWSNRSSYIHPLSELPG